MSYRYDHPDWLTNHASLWNAILAKYAPKRIIEIGSFEGRSACHVIDQRSKYDELELMCVDPWSSNAELADVNFEQVEKNFDHNIQLAIDSAPNKVTVHKLKGESIRGLSQLICSDYGQADLIYIDGSHLAADVLVDAVLSFRLLRVGGVMIFDDYNSPNPETVEFPKVGIDAFLRVYSTKMRPVAFNVMVDGREVNLYEYIENENKKLYQLYLIKMTE